jgi:hypothetical protein
MLRLDATGAPKWSNHFGPCTIMDLRRSATPARGRREREFTTRAWLRGLRGSVARQVTPPYSDSAILNVSVSSSW